MKLLDESDGDLYYDLTEFGVRMPFRPADFTQVNPFINDVLVSKALRLLAVLPTERVIDWFCGLGNFSLPLATIANDVLGVEGSETLVKRAQDNYTLFAASKPAGAVATTGFAARNLFEMTPEVLRNDGTADKWLVDPPRDGAMALCTALVGAVAMASSGWRPPKRIVYVSCNPATLARDAGILVDSGLYVLSAAGVVNMFPHTAHVESMAQFDLVG